MSKKYIITRGALNQDHVDNWLMMIPTRLVSSDAKIVWIALKKMQANDLSCATDAHSWGKITGLQWGRVKECLKELIDYGLIELYLSPRQMLKQQKRICDAYLLEHFQMKGMYRTTDQCPHDGHSLPDPLDDKHYIKNSRIAKHIKEFREQSEQYKHDANQDGQTA